MAKFFGNGLEKPENNFEFIHQENKSNPITSVVIKNSIAEDPWYPGLEDYAGIVEIFASQSSSEGRLIRQKRINLKKYSRKRRFDILSMFQPGDFLNKVSQSEL